MSIHKIDSKGIVKFDFVISCFSFRGLISTLHVMLCARSNIFYYRYGELISINPSPKHQTIVKHILKYLRRMRDYVLVF